MNYFVIPGLTESPTTHLTIVKAVSEHYNNVDIKANTHARHITEPRQIAMWFEKQLSPEVSLKEIARRYSRTHATVIFAINQVENMMATDRKFKQKIEKIYENINFTIKNIYP